MFYHRHNFCIVSYDWDGEVMKRLLLLCRQYEVKGRQCATTVVGGPNWTNLKKWVREYHERKNREAIPWEKAQRRELKWIIIGAIFEMAKQSRDRPWEEVEKLTETQRVVLGNLDKRWMS